MNRAEKALEYFQNGNNCCQAVLLAFADLLPLNEEQLRAAGSCFGVGMGALEATCGALCGAQMAQGMAKFAGRPLSGDARTLLQAFKEKCGASDCGTLKGRTTGKVLCPCTDCVKNAAAILSERLQEN